MRAGGVTLRQDGFRTEPPTGEGGDNTCGTESGKGARTGVAGERIGGVEGEAGGEAKGQGTWTHGNSGRDAVRRRRRCWNGL